MKSSIEAIHLAVTLLAVAVPRVAGQQPNILFIPVDDLKPLLGCYGNDKILTPNMDRLAARGTVFLNNSCQQAICGPSRASILTGLYPDQTRVWDLETRMRDVRPDIVTLPQYFRQQGYRTVGLGKTFDPRCVDDQHDAPSWSIPYESIKPVRSRECFQDYVAPATLSAGRKAAARLSDRVFRMEWMRDREIASTGGPLARPSTESMDVPDDAYPDGALAEAALKTLDDLARHPTPFFLSVGFHKPHLPFAVPQKYWDLYDRKSIELAHFQQHSVNGPDVAYNDLGELRTYSDIPQKGVVLPEDVQRRLVHGYMAAVSYVDAQIGRVLDRLEELGLADNTIICLWGDHGWHLGDHGNWCKHTNFEQAVRSPLIIADPRVHSAATTESISELVDVFPTLCELAGLEIPAHLPGKSLTPLLTDPTSKIRTDAMAQYPRSIEGEPCMGYTLRNKRYRYVKWLKMDLKRGDRTGSVVARELYDLIDDPLETRNLADHPEHDQVVQAFEASLRQRGYGQEAN